MDSGRGSRPPAVTMIASAVFGGACEAIAQACASKGAGIAARNVSSAP
jgi:hypothetical protein